MSAILHQFLSQATAKNSKSSALHPLLWAFGICVGGVPVVAWATPNPWIWGSMLVGAAILLISILSAYFYFMVNDPDALRSESFKLSKMALEKGMMGDSIVGLVDVNALSNEPRSPRVITQENVNG